MRKAKSALKWVFYFLTIPISYLIVALGLSLITVDRSSEMGESEKKIYLSTNGVHLDIVIPIGQADDSLLDGLQYWPSDHYLAFGWGDENFYLNTPTWGDLTVKSAFTAMFLKSSTLVHLTRYRSRQANWIEIPLSQREFNALSRYLLETFQTNEKGEKIRLADSGYSATDDFYKARGSYSIFNTCNSWVNAGFKKSGLKACLWTPFDFGLLNKYQ